MRQRFFFLALLSFLFIQNSQAQLSQVIHQTFDIDEAASVALNIFGEYEIEKWAGNTIMTETSIQIYDATPSILKHFVKEGRYEIVGESEETAFRLDSKDIERKAIRTKRGECYEFVKIRVFVPEDFDIVDQKRLIRTAEEEASNN